MIDLPFPPSILNPNSRPHWAKKARAVRVYKMQCFALLSQHRTDLAGQHAFEIRFSPPDERRRDTDNMLAASKAALDALSAVCGIDDSKFTLTLTKCKPVKGGALTVSWNPHAGRGQEASTHREV